MSDVFDLASMLVLRLSSIALGRNSVATASLDELQSVQALDVLLQTARALVGRLINRHRLLDRIPPEILVHIFSLVSHDDRGRGQAYRPSGYYSPWAPKGPIGRPRNLVRLTAVCQRWRNILLQTPLLWSFIEDTDKEGQSFIHYVDRCSRGPLFVHTYRSPHSLMLGFLASHGQRVRDLFMNMSGPSDIINSFRGEELRRCRLDFLMDCHVNNYTGPSFQTFFQGCAPQLQRLQLLDYPFLPCNHFPTLTHLILDCPLWVAFSVRDLQVFLSGCPRLQSLHIQTRPTTHIKAPSDTASPVPVFLASPQLRKFSMIDATKKDDPIWSPVNQARVTRDRIVRSAIQRVLLLTVVQSPQCLVYIDPVVSSVIQTFMDHMSTLIKPSSMRIVHKYESLDRMGGWVRPRISLTLIHPSEPGGVRLNVQPEDDAEDEEIMRLNLQRTIAASPLFSDIRELWLDGNAPQLLRPPHSILQSLPNLQYLQVICDHLGEPEWTAQGTFEALSHAEGGGLVCPQLESLYVLVLAAQPTERAQVVFAQIRTLVERRISLGCPLKRLYISIIVKPGGTSNPRLISETRRELGSLVEHFDLHARKHAWARFLHDDCWREWDDRLPLGCRSGDELVGYWPAWKRDIWV